jgi:hypothetical protein
MELVPVVAELHGSIVNLIQRSLQLQVEEVVVESPELQMRMPLRRMNQQELVEADLIAVQLLQTAELPEVVA